MKLLLRIVIGLITTGIGFLFVAKSYKVVHKIGYNNWAETHIGGGGTYILIKGIGFLLMFLSILFIFGIIKIF